MKPQVIPESSISEILDMDDGVTVNLNPSKVVSVEPPSAVGTGLVQDVTLSDGDNTINLSVWDGNTNKFEVLQVYKFVHPFVSGYQKFNFFSPK
uniref:Replication protein A OB domain-containing protein n=1 Tax=Amphimedon queenslandica TaxID=400682 RepID=A0A1X7V3E5_AMPQE